MSPAPVAQERSTSSAAVDNGWEQGFFCGGMKDDYYIKGWL